MKNLATISHLREKFQFTQFAEKTIFQINKDLSGLVDELVPINVSSAINKLDELIFRLTPILIELEKGNQLQQYIYKVDLMEKEWVTFLATQDYKMLSEKIIIREAQKVFLREMFKNT
jgi:hypothetical protein